jgi:hypothetical protein
MYTLGKMDRKKKLENIDKLIWQRQTKGKGTKERKCR